MFVLPMIITPAARTRRTTVASWLRTNEARPFVLPVVMISAVSSHRNTVAARWSAGTRSAARASDSAASGRSCTTAFSFRLTALMRSRNAAGDGIARELAASQRGCECSDGNRTQVVRVLTSSMISGEPGQANRIKDLGGLPVPC